MKSLSHTGVVLLLEVLLVQLYTTVVYGCTIRDNLGNTYDFTGLGTNTYRATQTGSTWNCMLLTTLHYIYNMSLSLSLCVCVSRPLCCLQTIFHFVVIMPHVMDSNILSHKVMHPMVSVSPDYHTGWIPMFKIYNLWV